MSCFIVLVLFYSIIVKDTKELHMLTKVPIQACSMIQQSCQCKFTIINSLLLAIGCHGLRIRKYGDGTEMRCVCYHGYNIVLHRKNGALLFYWEEGRETCVVGSSVGSSVVTCWKNFHGNGCLQPLGPNCQCPVLVRHDTVTQTFTIGMMPV